MDFLFDAACFSRAKKGPPFNADNFIFDGKCLPEEHGSLPHPVTKLTPLHGEQVVAVFAGKGSEVFGKKVSFAAADRLREQLRLLTDYVIPERRFLEDTAQMINDSVLRCAEGSGMPRPDAAMAALYFSHGYAYVCDLGDCRAFRLRDGEFLQISDERAAVSPPESSAPSERCFGLPPEEFVRPHIAKGELRHGDQYLLCTAGLTEALSNLEIAGILENASGAEVCVQRLIDAAMQRGSSKSVTAILCRIH